MVLWLMHSALGELAQRANPQSIYMIYMFCTAKGIV